MKKNIAEMRLTYRKSSFSVNFEKMKRKIMKTDQIPIRENWGRYVAIPYLVEFWQGLPSRLHDLLQYKRNGNFWGINRLAP